MDSTLAYEIGAVFLFAAMVMFGTWTGLTKKLFGLFGTKSIIALVAAGLCFVFYQYSSQILAALPLGSTESSRESVPASAKAVSAVPAVSTTPAPSVVRTPRTVASSAKPVEHWKTVVVEDSTPAPLVAQTPAPSPMLTPASPSAVEPAKVDPCDKSQYQGKFKRWMKSAGCAIHVVPRK